MEESERKNDKGNLLHLLVFTAFLFLLAFVLNAGPVFAPGAGPYQVDPGEGGGETPPCTINGFIVDYDEWSYVHNMTVYLHISGNIWTVTTDYGGYFSFHSGGILAYTDYLITVNGIDDSALGTWLDNKLYGQRATIVHTDEEAFASVVIPLQHRTVVNVTAAALFSNTQYANISYKMGISSDFDHTTTFNAGGTGISTGYTHSIRAVGGFRVRPTYSAHYACPWYAVSCWDDRRPGITYSGLTEKVEHRFWGTLPSTEYVNPQNLSVEYYDFSVAPGAPVYYWYTETGSHTWSLSMGIDFAIELLHFGIPVELTTTVTSTQGVTNTVEFTVDNTTNDILYFRLCIMGAPYDPNERRGGMELHLWQKDW